MLILFVGGITVFNIAGGLVIGFGEEFGWRGPIFPRLLRLALWKTLIGGSAI